MLKFYLVLNITGIKKVVKLIFIVSPGRCASTLLLQMINQKVAHDLNKTADQVGFSNLPFEKDSREKHQVFHTHSLGDCKNILNEDLVYFILRKNLVDYVASHLISQDLQTWHWLPNQTPTISIFKKMPPENQIKIIIRQLYWYRDSYKKYSKKFHSVHLIFYEDFVTNFSVPGIDLSNTLDQVCYFATTPVDKTQYFDYDHLTELVKKYNNDSIYFDFDFNFERVRNQSLK